MVIQFGTDFQADCHEGNVSVPVLVHFVALSICGMWADQDTRGMEASDW